MDRQRVGGGLIIVGLAMGAAVGGVVVATGPSDSGLASWVVPVGIMLATSSFAVGLGLLSASNPPFSGTAQGVLALSLAAVAAMAGLSLAPGFATSRIDLLIWPLMISLGVGVLSFVATVWHLLQTPGRPRVVGMIFVAAPLIYFTPKALPFIDPFSDEGLAIATISGNLVAVAFVVGTLAYGLLALVGNTWDTGGPVRRSG